MRHLEPPRRSVTAATHARPVAMLVAAAALALAACSAAPPVHLHTLMPGDLPARAAGAATQPPLSIVLEPLRIPTQVDQPQWLIRLGDDSVAALEQERWASPLRDELRQALLEELIVRYGAVESRAAAAAPMRIGVDVRRFDSIPGREARIEGSWTIAGANASAPASRCEWLMRESAAMGMPALAAAHRRAVTRLGDAIGDTLVHLARGEAAPCPARDEPR